MRRILRCVGLTLALVFLPTAFAQDKKPDPTDKPNPTDKPMAVDKNAPKTQKEALDKMHVGGEISGKLTRWGGSDKGFTLQVPLTYYVLNDGEYRALAQAQVDLAKARNANDLYNAQKAILDHQSRLYNVQKKDVNIEFTQGADMKVRILHPMVYDDKGKPKKLTKKELDELKGTDKKLPGYTADASDIKQDMIVTVYIEKKKPTKTTKGKDDKDLADTKVEALMILIVADAPPKQ